MLDSGCKGDAVVRSFFEKSSKLRFWLVIVSDVFMLSLIPIFIEDASIGLGVALLVAGAAVWHSIANWPYQAKR